ncbi:hypothetical protein V6N13_053440 [Hibiscus sabdariffa]|uniref:RNase H type-1 domain-containing protein n=1 Tax=Hibiscus sabdariffa TaxID=183260 RepID=A0ABR2T7W4_9ROSI
MTSEISAILKNVHDQRSSFHSLSFLHVKRKGNEAAHLLANEGRKFASKRVWIEEAPSCVEAAVISDRWWVDPVALDTTSLVVLRDYPYPYSDIFMIVPSAPQCFMAQYLS